MKKLTLVLGALIMTFMLNSCTNKKDAVIALFNSFFDHEVTALNNVSNADDFLSFLTASDERFNAFYAQLDKEYPITEDDEFVGFNKADSDAAMKVYNDRMEAFENLRDTKGEELFEPYLAKLENVVNGLADDLMNDVEPADDIVDQILAAYDDIEKYGDLGSDAQAERFGETDSLVQLIFGLNEEEEVAE